MSMGSSANGRLAFELPLIFESLSGSVRARFLKNAVLKTMATGEVLFEQGDLPSCLYVVVAGSVQLSGRSTAGREVLIETLGPPELVSLATVLMSSPYLVRARVAQPARLLVIEAEFFRAAAMRDPGLAREIQFSLSCQFRRMLRQVKNLKLRDTKERVGCYLLALSVQQGTPGLAVLPYEKSLIAAELGMTRESFSRALSALKVHGISVRGDRVVIEDENRLARACRPDPLIDDPEQISGPDRAGRAPQRIDAPAG
jgi:CRP/FNR family transcriptional activator FtrB